MHPFHHHHHDQHCEHHHPHLWDRFRGSREEHGSAPWGPWGFGRGPGRGRGGRAGRGDLRAAILWLLSEQPMHGYQLITEIKERTEGNWTPSPGAVYPILSLLEDEQLITVSSESGRKLATLTPEGERRVKENEAEWSVILEAYREGDAEGEPQVQLHREMHRFIRALRSVDKRHATEAAAIVRKAAQDIEALG